MSDKDLPPCCHNPEPQTVKVPASPEVKGCCSKKKRDWLLWSMGLILLAALFLHYWLPDVLEKSGRLEQFVESAVHLLHKMWLGLLLGILFVGILAGVPKSLLYSLLGKGGTWGGILRATAGGVLLDLCSHGVLLVGMQLYRKGASLGQVMAFLIASPWNSLSMTVILWSLVGLKWTLAVLILSFVVAIISGVIFDKLVAGKVLAANPNSEHLVSNGARQEVRDWLRGIRWSPFSLVRTMILGLSEARMLLRWIFLGVVLTALIRTFVSAELFQQYFGPTLLGLGATLLAATVIEVCSEGSIPIASDFILRAGAPGNTFAFLMTGVATDYTEILALRETTKSWKIALFLPLVTVPQVVLIAVLMNHLYGAG